MDSVQKIMDVMKQIEYVFSDKLNKKEVFNFKIENATTNDLERIKKYKLETIIEHAENLSKKEITRINNYICESVPTLIKEYKNIIYNKKIIGSFLVKKIESGLLLDEIFIDKEYRNKGFGYTIIKDYVLTYNENVYLWVYKNNINAFNLYKKLNFKIKEETETRYYMEYSK